MALTPKQQAFADYYLETGNATEAAKRAGYSEQTAGIIGFDNVDIIDLFNLRLDSVAYDIKSTAVNVMQYLIKGELTKTVMYEPIKEYKKQ